jgi:hypothetical protein
MVAADKIVKSPPVNRLKIFLRIKKIQKRGKQNFKTKKRKFKISF